MVPLNFSVFDSDPGISMQWHILSKPNFWDPLGSEKLDFPWIYFIFVYKLTIITIIKTVCVDCIKCIGHLFRRRSSDSNSSRRWDRFIDRMWQISDVFLDQSTYYVRRCDHYIILLSCLVLFDMTCDRNFKYLPPWQCLLLSIHILKHYFFAA